LSVELNVDSIAVSLLSDLLSYWSC